MTRANTEDSRLYDPTIVNGLKFGVHIQTLAAALTIDRDMQTLAFLTPTATRVVTLPAAERGLAFLVYNGAALGSGFDLTINNPAAATIGTISPVELGILFSDGTNWYCTMVGLST